MNVRILQIALLTFIASPAQAIRMRTAGVLTGLSAAMSAAGSTYVMQKSGAYLPEMSHEMYATLVSAYVLTSTVPTGYWLYNRTPQGRLRLAANDLKKVTSDPLTQPAHGESALAVMNRVYVNKDFPYIESLHALQAHDAKLKKIKELLAKGRSDLRSNDTGLIERYDDVECEAQFTHKTVLEMIQAVRDLPDYTKRLKYFNEQKAQVTQAEAQQEQAKAQKVIAGASVVGAFAKVIEAINPFKRRS